MSDLVAQGGFLSPSAPVAGNALATIASNEATNQVLASIWIAKQFPRSLAEVTLRINDACARVRLAQVATYSYPRGGQTVTGASIRLAEQLLSCYGNAEAGWLELSRRFDPSGARGQGCNVSTCRAYCFDKEANIKREIAFDVPHVRESGKEPNKKVSVLNDPRDIYELCANMASRRIRACILQVIPSHLTDEALEKCAATLRKNDKSKPLVDRIREMEARFAAIGVTREMLECRLGHSLAECVVTEVVELGGVHNSIRDGYTRIKDVFPMPHVEASAAVVEPSIAQVTSAPLKEANKKPTRSRVTAPAPAPAPERRLPPIDDAPPSLDGLGDVDDIGETVGWPSEPVSSELFDASATLNPPSYNDGEH